MSEQVAKLKHLSAQVAHQAVESRQVAKRLQELLPQRLNSLKQKYRGQEGVNATQALRKALLDPQYQEFVNELLNLREVALANRIKWETLQLQVKLEYY